MMLSKKRITKALIRLRGCAGWSAPVLFANPRRQGFSRVVAHIIISTGSKLSKILKKKRFRRSATELTIELAVVADELETAAITKGLSTSDQERIDMMAMHFTGVGLEYFYVLCANRIQKDYHNHKSVYV